MRRSYLIPVAIPAVLAATVTCTGPGKPVAAPPRPKDNQACLHCHSSLRNDSLSKDHERVGQLCVDCHGPSEAHRASHGHGARPDVVFARADVAPFCQKCHDPAKHPQGETKRFIEEWKGRRRPNGREITADSVCTDCHGNHVRHRRGR
jgi:hypothetical protein